MRCRDDFLGVIRALEEAQPGDVIVVDGGGRETALADELFARPGRAVVAAVHCLKGTATESSMDDAAATPAVRAYG